MPGTVARDPAQSKIDVHTLRLYARRIRKAARFRAGVRIRWILDDALAARHLNGECESPSPHRYVIRIDSNLTCHHAWDVLVHEVAHALQWERAPHSPDHGEAWGRMLAEIWSRLVKERK